jgi:hypothetical protein
LRTVWRPAAGRIAIFRARSDILDLKQVAFGEAEWVLGV